MRLPSLLFISCLAACGGQADDAPPGAAQPMLIAGGGVADGPISGVLHVHVIEPGSDRPIAGASVTIASGTAITDAAGLATFDDVTGPQTITASAAGRATATWVGVNGANATLPLQLQRVPMARVRGSLANGLAVPALGRYTLAVVLYSFLEDPTAPENSIPQSTSAGMLLNTCINTNPIGVPANCSWQLNTRVGKQIHTAVIVEGDPKGTNNDPSDDTYRLLGYAAGEVMTLTEGQDVGGEVLMPVTDTQSLAVTFPPAAPGLPYAVAIPELQLADGAGRIVFPLPTLTAASPSTQVLAPTGKFAGTYELVALATPSATAKVPFSTSFLHNVSGTATLPPWLAPPTVGAGSGSFSFTATAGAAFHTVQFVRDSMPLWNVTLLDGSSSFTRPANVADPIGAGPATYTVTAADVQNFNPFDFQLSTFKASLARAAGAQASL